MSLFNTLQTGASGLGTSSMSLGVIGDNIANLNTVGFKRSTASFEDAFPSMIGASSGISAMGNGTVAGGIRAAFAQGMMEATSSPLDMAISGGGFFPVRAGNQTFYSRDGSFALDHDGFLVNGAGLKVQGYQAFDDAVSSVVGDLQIQTGPVQPAESENITLDLVLASQEDFSTTPYGGLTLDGTAIGVEEASAEADFSTSVSVYDSLGRKHDVVINFEQTGANDWTWSAIIDAGETDAAGAVDGMALEISSGSLTFDTEGNLTAMTQTPTAISWLWPGADTFDFTLNMGLPDVDGQVRMVGSEPDDTSSVTSVAQDGYGVGNLTSVSVDPDGKVQAMYSNGEQRVLGQIALALFPSDAGLVRVGGNLYAETTASGEPALGVPGTGGRGTTTGYALEASNVELEDEFVGMIAAQRSYQASASVVQSADETLQELVNLV